MENTLDEFELESTKNVGGRTPIQGNASLITFLAPADSKDYLKHLAKTEGRSVPEVLRRIVRKHRETYSHATEGCEDGFQVNGSESLGGKSTRFTFTLSVGEKEVLKQMANGGRHSCGTILRLLIHDGMNKYKNKNHVGFPEHTGAGQNESDFDEYK